MPKGIKPTLKQKKWIAEYLRTGNGQGAARVAYPNTTEGTQNYLGAVNPHKPAIKSYIAEVLDKRGLSDAKIADSLNQVVDAGLTKRSLRKAQTADTLRALEMASRLKDLFPAEKMRIDKRVVTMDLGRKSTEELLQILENTQKEAVAFTKLVRDSEEAKLTREAENSESNLQNNYGEVI